MRKLIWIILLFITWFVFHIMILLWVGIHEDAQPADAAVVFGSGIEDSGQPHPRLQARLDRAAKLFQENMVTKIMVSGAVGDSGFEEAEVMRDTLVKAGIPNDAIIVDRLGETTYETAKNTRRFLHEKNLHSVVVVSQYYHILRIKLAFKHFGIAPVTSAHADINCEWRDLYSLPREFVAYYYYLIRSYPDN